MKNNYFKDNMKRVVLIFTVFFLSFNNNIFSQAQINTGVIGVDVNIYGRISIYTPATNGIRQIERLSVLAGISPNEVFDYHNDSFIEDTTGLISDSLEADYIIYGSYNNTYSGLPPDVLHKMYVYGWLNNPYIIIKNVIVNREEAPVNAKIGLDIITQLNGSYGLDTVQYSFDYDLIDIKKINHIGIKSLSHPFTSLYSFEWYAGYMIDSSYWQWLNYNIIDTIFTSGNLGPVIIPSHQYININPGDSIEIYYALVAANTFSEVLQGMSKAETKYSLLTNIDFTAGNIPGKFILNQNYPNPFNPSTNISFSIPQRDFVSLKIYSSLGEEISEIVNKELDSGEYNFKFNAGDLASGFYFYTLTAGGFSKSKKMILLK